MPFNPFNNDNEDSSFEQGMPVTQAAKQVAKTTTAQASKQIKDDTKAIVDQLYGVSTPQGEEQEPNASTNPQASAHASSSAQSGTNDGNAKSPEEQAKMEQVRRELFSNYSAKFRSAPNGPFGLTTDVEQEMEKARQERKRKEEERKRQQEEEEQRKQEEKKNQKEEVAMPAGKKTGMMFGKKQQQPIALRMAKTKTEINRGTSG